MRIHLLVLAGCTLLARTGFADAVPPALDAKTIAKSAVCTDGKSHYLAITPDPDRSHHLYYGDATTLTSVLPDPSRMVQGTDFQDPRFPNPTANPDFRGIDWRNYSGVEYDDDKQTCSLRCGEKKQTLTVLPAADAKKLLAAATLKASPHTREPYELARDDHGTYYYVDRGLTPDTRQNYRVWVGKKGALKLQKMKDVAADSEGEVFSTALGDLRFVTVGEQYTWVQGQKKVPLVKLPIDANLPLIYNTLGIYTGQRLGTPCDDF